MAECVASFEDFPNICRLCLGREELKVMSTIPKFVHNLKSITTIKVTPQDKLPKSVCTACIEKLNYVNCFIQSCKSNDAILKTLLLQEEDKSALQNLEGIQNPDSIKIEPAEEIQVKLENNDENREENIITVKIEHQKSDSAPAQKIIDKDEKEKTFSGDKCAFPSSVTRRTHIKSRKIPKKRHDMCKCIYCCKFFTRKSDLQRHLRIHTGVKLFSCTLCNKKFTQKNSLDRHNLLHSGKFTCMVCNKSFTRESYLEKHKKIHNRKGELSELENSLKCNFCGKVFSSRRYLAGHVRMHTGSKDFKCDICHRTFPVKNSLDRHIISHTDIKEFRCDKCDAAFNRNTLLERHKKIHDEHSEEKRKLTCPECGKYFLYPSHLRRHMAVHNPSQRVVIFKRKPQVQSPRLYLCSYCGKQFRQSSNLKIHVRTHTGEKLKCSVCGRGYLTKDALKNHMMAHRGEKPFPCPYCDKWFRKPSLYRHILIHKDIRRFTCETCKKTFIRKDQLDQHLRIHK